MKCSVGCGVCNSQEVCTTCVDGYLNKEGVCTPGCVDGKYLKDGACVTCN